VALKLSSSENQEPGSGRYQRNRRRAHHQHGNKNMELLTQGSWQAIALAIAGLFVIALLGHAAKDLWGQIKNNPLIAAAAILTVGLTAGGFALVSHAIAWLGDGKEPAVVLHAKYVLLMSTLVALMFTTSALILVAMVLKYIHEVREELHRFQSSLTTSPPAAMRKP
jgi:hypothetical protein